MQGDGGYGAVLADRPIRRLLAASLAGRLAFSMLPLGLVLFARAHTMSSAAAGALVAAFVLPSALAPLRGRIVDRRGPPVLIGFAVVCAAGLLGLTLAGSLHAPVAVLLALGALAGAAVPPLGPWTRAVWGAALRDGGGRLQRVYALDSAGEEAALIVAPFAVGLIVAAGHPSAPLAVAAGGLLAGTAASGRSPLSARLVRSELPAETAPARMPTALWLAIASLLGPGAALGAIDVAVPAVTSPARSGLLLSTLAVGTAAASLLAGRHTWRWTPGARLCVLQALLVVALALGALAAGRPAVLAAVLVLAGAIFGALFVTLYLLVDRLSPPGSGTRTFAWLVTANNGGLAVGAAGAGALVSEYDPAAGLWLAAACALAGTVLAAGTRAKF